MLHSCDHDGDCLTVTFQNGLKYKYEGVPTHEFQAFTKADSAGAHFGKNIKNNYKCTKL